MRSDREAREWLCSVLALCVGAPLVFFVVHLLFYATVVPEPPAIYEAEALCRHASLTNVTVREQHRVALQSDSSSSNNVEVDVTYLRYRVLCVLQHNTTLTVSKTYVLDAFGTGDSELARQANASAAAHALYPLDAPPSRRWYYTVAPGGAAATAAGGETTYVEEEPRALSLLTRLARWLYYMVLLCGTGPLCYLGIYAVTMHSGALPLPLLALAFRLRSPPFGKHTSPV